MSSVLRFYKVLALPTTPEANAVYFVLGQGGEVAEQWLTSLAGVPRPVGNTQFIERITDALDLRFATKDYVDDAVDDLAEEGVDLNPDFILDGGNF